MEGWQIGDAHLTHSGRFLQHGITGVTINTISKTLVLAYAFERPQVFTNPF